jgi:acyl-CoA synthetase (AMP-forming)/AMP-acid ligase II
MDTVAPLSRALERSAQWYTDRTALRIIGGGTLTYGEMNERVNSMANALHDRGIRRGDRVGIACYNTAEFPIALYACHKRGFVPVAINGRLSGEDFGYILTELNAEVVVYDTDLNAVEKGAAAAARPLDLIGVQGERESDEPDAWFDDLIAEGSSEKPPRYSKGHDEIAYMFYTSGTTGKPKAVAHSPDSARTRTRTGMETSRVHGGTTCLLLLPLYHGGGLDTTLRPLVMSGAELIMGKDLDDDTVLETIQRHAVTDVRSVPTLTKRLADRDDVESFDLSSVETWRNTGGVLTEEQATQFVETLTPNILNAYGSSESGTNALLGPEDLPEHAGSVGQPTLGDDIRVIEYDPSREVGPDETVPEGEQGEVIVWSEQMFLGYYENEELARKRVREGWYYTHDLGVVEDGFLMITGRTDDHLVSGGELVSAVEVEEALGTHPGVRESVVVGVPDEEWGERVRAYVSPREGANPSVVDLEAHCKQGGLADYKRPREYEFVDEIAVTDTGKKRREHYRQHACEEGDVP